MKTVQIHSIDVCFAHRFGDRRWFEAVVRYGDDYHRTTVDLPLDELRQKGIAKTLNSWKKVQAWVDGDEGWAYVERKLAENHRERSI